MRLNQARAYQHQHYNEFIRWGESNVQFKFGDHIAPGIGKIRIKIPITSGTHLHLEIDVVDLDIPLILGLDVLRNDKLLVNYIDNTIYFCNHAVRRPIVHKLGHVFLEWNEQEILFSKDELRLHRHFVHPSGSKLHQLIAHADPSKANPSTRRLIEEISAACHNRKTYQSSPLRFKAAIPADRNIFNQVLSIDLLWLQERPALHIIDEQTGFRSAAFLKSKSASSIWDAFIAC